MAGTRNAAGKNGYGADAIEMLEGLDAVRKRPGMYIGGTGPEGLVHLLWELIDNAIDEAAAGHATRVGVAFHADGSYEVADDGRGIPTGRHAKKRVSALEVVFTELHAGGKFGGGAYAASGGLHGVGASVVNALSRRLVVEVERDGLRSRLCFNERVAGQFDDQDTFRRTHDLEAVAKVPRSRTGTRVRFWPDTDIFEEGAAIEVADVRGRLEQMSFLVPGIEIVLADRRRGASGEPQVFKSKLGLADYVESMSVGEPVTDVITLSGTDSFVEKVPVGGKLTEVSRECQVELAYRWVKGFDTTLVSFVNTIPTSDGGTHVAGFERALTYVTNNSLLGEAKKLKRFKDDGRSLKEDVQEGLVAVLKVTVPEPQFRGQTKRELGTPAVQSVTYNVVKAGLENWLRTGKKTQVNALRDKVIAAITTRLTQRQQREALRRASALGSAGLPPKLADCRTTDVASSELLIVEGDSAAGPTKEGRNSETQAVLPIRGKIINAGKANLKQVLDNAEAEAIFTALGAGSGKDFNLDACRYGRVVILADADVDGAHIRCLLLTLFFHFTRPLLAAGRVYVAMPPLFTVSEKGRNPAKHYAYEDVDRIRICDALDAAGKTYTVGRNKGLGEMDVDELAYTTLDPATRVLRRVTIDDAAAMVDATRRFETLMGRDVEERRNFIVANSALFDREALDI